MRSLEEQYLAVTLFIDLAHETEKTEPKKTVLLPVDALTSNQT